MSLPLLLQCMLCHVAFHVCVDVACVYILDRQGVHHWHRHGMLHKDIKPSNVGIHESTGEVRIFDANIAQDIQSCQTAKRWAGKVVVDGTEGYIAPEVQASGQWTPSGESYSVGITIQEVGLCVLSV